MTATSEMTVSQIIQRQLSLFWVRRYLLIVPLLISLPLGILLSYMLPRAYVATSLLLLQESNGSPLLGNTPMQPFQPQDRVNGLQALLKSDHVLKPVLDEMQRDAPPMSAKQQTQALRALQDAISISMISSDVIEVQLKGGTAEGLGKTLETITARLLESLMAPEDVIMTAPQVIVERRREVFTAAEAAYKEFLNQQNASKALLSRGGTVETQKLASLTQAQHKTRDEIDSARAALKITPGQTGPLDANIDAARAKLAELGSRTDAERLDVSIAKKQLEQLIGLRNLESIYSERQAEIDKLVTTVAEGRQALAELNAQEGKRKQLLAAMEASRERLLDAERRFGTRSAKTKFQLLRAPEQITIIDAPKDPETPLYRRGLIIAFTVGTGLVLGLGLALMAALVDGRLRSSEVLGRITGAPVWGRLPKAG